MTTDGLDVLLIEDNPGDARLIEEYLGGTNGSASTDGENSRVTTRNVRRASRLADGIQQLADAAPDVVLLDLGLPDSTGVATVAAVRDQTRSVPIVVLTGQDDETVGIQAVTQGAQEYLIKDELTPALLGRSLRHAIERKKFERTRTGLHRASRDLIQAESREAVGQLAVDTAVDVLDIAGIAVYLFDDQANELHPTAYTDYLAEMFGEMPAFGPDDTAITWQAFITGETVAYDDVLESEHIHRTDTSVESGIWIPLGDHGVMAILSETTGEFDQRTRQLADHLAATAEAALDRVGREESLREHERELERQNSRLADLDRMNEIIREIDQALVQATTRDAIERAVCERLTRDERFAFAWIGETDDAEVIVPRTWAGADRGYLDAVSLETDAEDPPPSVTAALSGNVTAVPNVGGNLGGESWRRTAIDRDLQSAISIPLTYNDLSYGVLTVFGTEREEFSRTTDVFAELGETIANAINSVETKQALLTDTMVELELVVPQPDDVLGRIAREGDCTIEYSGIVPQSEGTRSIFFSTDAAPEILDSVAEEIPSVQRLEHISDVETGGGRFELTITGSAIPSTIVECGAVVNSMETTASATRVVVELPGTMDVRTFIDRLESNYPDVELVARRDSERSERSREAFTNTLTGELTQRQLETIQTAYHSGYFEWPRDRTGEEVAESLGIAQPTFNGHLRSAERKLCALLFDDPAPPAGERDQHT